MTQETETGALYQPKVVGWGRIWKGGSKGRDLCIPLVAQTVKHLYTMWEIRVRSLGGEDPLETEMATHSSTLAWKIPWEKLGRL